MGTKGAWFLYKGQQFTAVSEPWRINIGGARDMLVVTWRSICNHPGCGAEFDYNYNHQWPINQGGAIRTCESHRRKNRNKIINGSVSEDGPPSTAFTSPAGYTPPPVAFEPVASKNQPVPILQTALHAEMAANGGKLLPATHGRVISAAPSRFESTFTAETPEVQFAAELVATLAYHMWRYSGRTLNTVTPLNIMTCAEQINGSPVWRRKWAQAKRWFDGGAGRVKEVFDFLLRSGSFGLTASATDDPNDKVNFYRVEINAGCGIFEELYLQDDKEPFGPPIELYGEPYDNDDDDSTLDAEAAAETVIFSAPAPTVAPPKTSGLSAQTFMAKINEKPPIELSEDDIIAGVTLIGGAMYTIMGQNATLAELLEEIESNKHLKTFSGYKKAKALMSVTETAEFLLKKANEFGAIKGNTSSHPSQVCASIVARFIGLKTYREREADEWD